MAHNPQIQFDFIVTANIPQYIGTGGLTNQYKTIGWLGDVATEACLTAGEAQLWPGAVNVGADASCPTEANATHDKFVDRAWFQVADASADLYVVQSQTFVNIPTHVLVNVQQPAAPLRFHLKGDTLYYVGAHQGANNPAVACPIGPSCPPIVVDLHTPAFGLVVLPAALIQLKVLPETIMYLPPGNKSFADLKVTKTFGVTVTAGRVTEVDDTTSLDNWMEEITSTGATGGISKIISFGYNDTSDSKFDTKTSLKTAQTVERDISNAIQQQVVFTHKMSANSSSVPGKSGTYLNAPFWNDEVVVLVHPQLAVWDFFGRKQVQMIAATNSSGTSNDDLLAQPDDVGIAISELDTCAKGAGYHIPMPVGADEVLSPAECTSLASLDPFYGKGQSADLTSRGQLLKNSEEYGVLLGNSMGEQSLDIQQTISDTVSTTDSNTAAYTATVEDILATSQSAGITLGGSSGPNVPVIDVGLTQTNTLKQGSTLDTPTGMVVTYKNSTATSFKTDVQVEGNVDDNVNRVSYTPRFEVWQDDAFGGLMFRDPDAPTQ